MTVRKNKKVDIRKNIWLIINFALIMTFGVLIAIHSEVIGIAAVADKAIVDHEAKEVTFNLTKDIIVETNKVMNKSIAISVGIYGICQLINYIVYLFNKKKLLLFLLGVELILAIVEVFINGNIDMFVVPIISGLIYFRVMKLEERG